MYNNIPETYAKGTIVEFMFTLANLSFTVTNVVSAESGQW
jgi:hypothetical protein